MQNLTTQIIFKRLLKDNTITQLSNEFRLSESAIRRYSKGGEVGLVALKKIIKSNIWTDLELEFWNKLHEKKAIHKAELAYNRFHKSNEVKPVAKCESCDTIIDNEKTDYSYIAGIITAIVLLLLVIPLLKYFDLL
jgi:hypothetical protein